MAKIEGRGNGALAYERQISNEISWVSWIFRAENSLYMYMRCFGWCDNLKEPHKLKKTSMDFFRGIFCRKPGKNQGIKTCIVNMGEVSETFDQVVKDFSWDFMVSRWVKMDTKSSKVNIFQVARAIKRPPWGSQYDVRKRVENDEQVNFLHVWHFFCNLLRLQLYTKPLQPDIKSFFGVAFLELFPTSCCANELQAICDQVFWKCQKLKWHKTRCVRSGISTVFTEFFWGVSPRNLRIWVPKQTTPTRRSV